MFVKTSCEEDIPSILLMKFREAKGIPRNHRRSSSAVPLHSALFQKPTQDLVIKESIPFMGLQKRRFNI